MRRVKSRILIIDSDEDFGNQVETILGDHQYEFHTVSNFLNALDACMTFLPNLILMEVTKEPKKAFQFVKDLEEYPEYAQSFFILTGQNPSDKVLRMAKALDLNEFLFKPVVNQKLIQKVRKTLLNYPEKRVELTTEFKTTCEVPITVMNHIENIITFSSPLKLASGNRYEIFNEEERLLNCKQSLIQNRITKGKEYQNALSFDPVKAPHQLKEILNPNLIYYLEEMLPLTNPRVIIFEGNNHNRSQLEYLLKRFKTSYTAHEEVKQNHLRDLSFYDIIIYGLKGIEADQEILNILRKEAPNSILFVCGSSMETQNLSKEFQSPFNILPRPIRRNNLLFNLAKVLSPDVIRKELLQGTPKYRNTEMTLSFKVRVKEVTEAGFILESPTMMTRNTEAKLNLFDDAGPQDLTQIDLLIKDITFNEETGIYQMFAQYSNLSSYHRASVMYYVQSQSPVAS